MCKSGRVDNVKATCNWRDQVERARLRARSQVFMADITKRDIWGARWDLETASGVVCSGAGRKELKFTC